MITQMDYEIAQKRALEYYQRAGIAVTPREAHMIEVTDFGLSDLWQTGLQLLIYINTPRVCAKEMVLLPWQTCPEHRHPPIGDDPGKEETFRCRWGTVYLYVPGEPVSLPRARPPENRRGFYTVWHEIVLRPGEQHILPPNTPHWFQSGSAGAVISEFSTHSNDETDIFTDPDIQRIPVFALD